MKQIMHGAEPFAFSGNEIGCLLIHGFTSTPAEMRPLGEYLAEKGYTVFGPRLFGHATELEDMYRARHEDWIVDVESAYLMTKDQCKTIFTMGQSMGAALALIAASLWQVAGAVGLAVPAALPPDPRLPYAKILSYLIPSFTKQGNRGSSWVDKQASSGHISYSAYPTRAVPELEQVIRTMHMRLPHIRSPVLILQSEHDPYAPPSHAEQIVQALDPELTELEILHESGHILTRDAQHEYVFQRVERFIESVIDRSPAGS